MKVCIVGGGVAGMTTAYRLMQDGHEVSLYEASPYLGGLVRTFEVGGSRLEAYYHHIFTTDTTIIKLIDELGVGDELKWIESKVGWFDNGKIYPFITPLDLLRFSPLPLLDRIKLGLMAVQLRGRKTGRSSSASPARTGSRRTSRRRSSRRCGARCCKASTATPTTRSPWRGSGARSTCASQSREARAEGVARLPQGQLRRLHRRDGAPPARRRRARSTPARPSQQITADNNRATGVVLADGDARRCRCRRRRRAVAALQEDGAAARPTTTPRKLDHVQWQGAVCMVVTMKRSLSPIYWMNIGDRTMPFLALVEHTNFIGPENYGGNHILYISNYLVAGPRVLRPERRRSSGRSSSPRSSASTRSSRPTG